MGRWCACGLVLVLAGCTDSGPSPSNTEFEIAATVQDARLSLNVTVYDVTAPVTANLLGDATVTATFRGQTVAVPLTTYGPYAYAAGIDLTDAVAADEPIAFTVARDDTTETVTNTMPGDFTLVQPTDARVGEAVDVSWSPTSNDSMSWQGECDVTIFEGPVPTDTGMLEFPPIVFNASPTVGCNAELTMTRARTASPYTGFAIYFQAEQQHTINFEIAP